MVIRALISMAFFFFAYTAVRTAARNLGFTCAIYFFVNVYYGTLYACTPEVSPTTFLPGMTCRFRLADDCPRVCRLLTEPLEKVLLSGATE